MPFIPHTEEEVRDMLDAIGADSIEQLFEPLTVLIPYSRGELISLFHERGQVSSEEHGPDGALLEGRIPRRLLPHFDHLQEVNT